MTPQAGGSAAETPTQEEEHQMQRMMAKRSKIIKELIQTERDYLNDLELCVREVVQPLRSKQVNASGRASHHILDETASTANPSPKLIRRGTCRRGVGRGSALWVPSLGRHKHHQTHASGVREGHSESLSLAKEIVF